MAQLRVRMLGDRREELLEPAIRGVVRKLRMNPLVKLDTLASPSAFASIDYEGSFTSDLVLAVERPIELGLK